MLQKYTTTLLIFSLVAAGTAAVLAESSKTKADELAGAVLFRDQGCVHCHGVGGIGGKKGPALIGLPTAKDWTLDRITKQILNGGQKMPPFSDALTDAQIGQLVTYLRAKHKPEPPPAPAADPTGIN